MIITVANDQEKQEVLAASEYLHFLKKIDTDYNAIVGQWCHYYLRPELVQVSSEEIVGWLMAWLPKGSSSYNFEFFAEKSKYDYKPLPDEEYYANIDGWQRATIELELLKQGKIKKFDMEVVDGYIMAVTGKTKPEKNS